MMLNRTNCDRKSEFSGILTKPLNPRAGAPLRSLYYGAPGAPLRSLYYGAPGTPLRSLYYGAPLRSLAISSIFKCNKRIGNKTLG